MSVHHYHSVEDLPHSSVEALHTAMAKTGTPEEWFESLAWIMAQESSGRVGIRNHTSSAVGLYQLTRVNYGCMPRHAASIGNAVDECVGGINYIKHRYHTADHAKEFWLAHNWY